VVVLGTALPATVGASLLATVGTSLLATVGASLPATVGREAEARTCLLPNTTPTVPAATQIITTAMIMMTPVVVR